MSTWASLALFAAVLLIPLGTAALVALMTRESRAARRDRIVREQLARRLPPAARRIRDLDSYDEHGRPW